jgi:hypothetical protein
MSRKPVLHEDEYETGDGQVRLTVIVGERQFGTSIVYIGHDAVANGDIDRLKLGEGDKLHGKDLTVYTLVTDVRNNTDDVAVTWILNGGEHKLSATETAKVAKDFGSQVFKAVFRLK